VRTILLYVDEEDKRNERTWTLKTLTKTKDGRQHRHSSPPLDHKHCIKEKHIIVVKNDDEDHDFIIIVMWP
jgi:hypothetical protein